MYDYTLPLGTTLYHGSSRIIHRHTFDPDRPMWVAREKEYALQYGAHITILTTTKTLRLLNVMHGSFHNDVSHRVYCDASLSFEDKCHILAPLGLPSLDCQLMYCARLDGGVYEWKDDPALKFSLDMHIPFVCGKHRYSLNTPGKPLDVNMARYLMKTYPEYDGYIAPTHWPSYHHGGFVLPEVCLFRPTECLQFDLKTKGGRTRQPGKGGAKPATEIPVKWQRTAVRDPACEPLWLPSPINLAGLAQRQDPVDLNNIKVVTAQR